MPCTSLACTGTAVRSPKRELIPEEGTSKRGSVGRGARSLRRCQPHGVRQREELYSVKRDAMQRGIRVVRCSSSRQSPTPVKEANASTGWASPTWSWGYAVGDAHDAADALRKKLSTEKSRAKWLNKLICNKKQVPWEEVKLALALLWQLASHQRRDGGLNGWGFVLEQLRLARYEGSFEADAKLVQDMEDRLPLLDAVVLELDWEEECVVDDSSYDRSSDVEDLGEEAERANDYEVRRRLVAAKVFVGLDFVTGGL